MQITKVLHHDKGFRVELIITFSRESLNPGFRVSSVNRRRSFVQWLCFRLMPLAKARGQVQRLDSRQPIL